jgi:hypothetical protein
MNQEQAGLLMVALMVVALGLAWWGWRNRQRRYAPFQEALTFGVPTGESRYASEALYVATTEADKPLERVAAGPLTYRSKVRVSVHTDGVGIAFPGKKNVLIAPDSGLSVGRATWTIDRVVERDGLVMMRWDLGGTGVDSYFRFVDGNATAFIDSVTELAKGKK